MRMFVQAGLTNICSFNALHLWCDEYLLYFCKEEQKKWVFTVVATASFLAGTRNLVSGSVQCSCGQCADIEKRSLVLARDDVLRAVCILWVYTFF